MTLPLVTPIAYRDPVAAFAALATEPMAVLLDSAVTGAQGRFSYIAAAPFRVIRSSPAPWRVTIDDQPVTDDPFAAIARTLAEFRQPFARLPAPFGGGAIGYFAYELGGVLEHLPTPRGRALPADMVVGLYDTIVAFDHEASAAWIIACGFPEHNDAARQARARLQTAVFTDRLEPRAAPVTMPARGWATAWHREIPRSAYEQKVAEIIELIRAGDIFQANLTQRFVAPVPPELDWMALYQRLRVQAPAPFAAFFNAGQGARLLSASPERFLAVDASGRVETRPIKGTRPRSSNPAQDKKLAAELIASGKDRAENLMIVDLLRNDLGRVCRPNSVAVPVLHGLETFPAVHHLVSVVTGQLRTDATAIDLLRACFPGGSVTGAPKIRAMEVIHDLEPAPRGPYCGTLAWFGFDGAMDSSIIIRSLISDGAQIFAQSGGGIVAESVPSDEYNESLVKAAPLLAALTESYREG